MKDKIKERVALYVWEIMHKKHDPILTNVFDAVIGAQDTRGREWCWTWQLNWESICLMVPNLG